MTELYKNWTRNAMHQRLNVARHFYTCLYKVSQDGGTCFDPLLFHFPEDDVTFKNIEHSFIYANTLKITPVLDYETSKSFYQRSYFPKGEWVNFNDLNDIVKSKGGEDGWKDLHTPSGAQDVINAHIMPGAIMLKQEGSFNTTSDLNLTNNPITLIANRDS
jgi:alpha-glucosidase (family GH31 glycosyl hydrolase)